MKNEADENVRVLHTCLQALTDLAWEGCLQLTERVEVASGDGEIEEREHEDPCGLPPTRPDYELAVNLSGEKTSHKNFPVMLHEVVSPEPGEPWCVVQGSGSRI